MNYTGRAVSSPQLASSAYYINKRIFDIIVALFALLFTGPIILICAIVVKLTSAGPAFYKAQRAGIGGKPFTMFKLRTMTVGTDTPDQKVTAANDVRITPIGKLLRKTKIDELPQLWNVLCGEMSIVGPRPEEQDIVERYFSANDMRALSVLPGLAAPADVRWYPDLTHHDPPPVDVPMQEWYLARHLPAQIAENIRYAEQQSIVFDLQIFFQMIFCVLVRSWHPSQPQPLSGEPLLKERLS